MAKAKADKNPRLERGDIYFLFRPRVGHDEAHGFKDLERFNILKLPRELVRQPLFEGKWK